MIKPEIYEMAKNMMDKMVHKEDADELQVSFAMLIIKTKLDKVPSEETMFKTLAHAGLIVHAYERQNNLHADSPTNLTTNE